jgi:ribosomal protein L31
MKSCSTGHKIWSAIKTAAAQGQIRQPNKLAVNIHIKIQEHVFSSGKQQQHKAQVRKII